MKMRRKKTPRRNKKKYRKKEIKKEMYKNKINGSMRWNMLAVFFLSLAFGGCEVETITIFALFRSL